MATDSVYVSFITKCAIEQVHHRAKGQVVQSVTVIVSRSLTDPTGLVMFTTRFKMFQVSALLSSVGPNFRGHGHMTNNFIEAGS